MSGKCVNDVWGKSLLCVRVQRVKVSWFTTSCCRQVCFWPQSLHSSSAHLRLSVTSCFSTMRLQELLHIQQDESSALQLSVGQCFLFVVCRFYSTWFESCFICCGSVKHTYITYGSNNGPLGYTVTRHTCTHCVCVQKGTLYRQIYVPRLLVLPRFNMQ